MATTVFRRALALELEDSVRETLLTNGRSKSRTIEEQRYFAGYADGLQAAADLVMTFAAEQAQDLEGERR